MLWKWGLGYGVRGQQMPRAGVLEDPVTNGVAAVSSSCLEQGGHCVVGSGMWEERGPCGQAGG